jgi:hypothetical protein
MQNPRLSERIDVILHQNNMVELFRLINRGWKKAESRGLWKLLAFILHHLTTICLL